MRFSLTYLTLRDLFFSARFLPIVIVKVYIVEYLFDKTRNTQKPDLDESSEIFVEFSVHELRESLEKQGYQLIDAKVRFILLWKSKNDDTNEEEEIKIVLPELYFEK